MEAFLTSTTDTYAIMQLAYTDETELEEMSASLVRKVSAMTDEDFKQTFPG